MSDKSYLVVGLGNIGAEYAATRHNIGFMVLDAWAQASNISFETKRYGDVATDAVKGRKFHLLKPSTYMNLSGYAVRYWLQELDIPLENLIVICDDINLPFGTMRLRKGGSAGGHNGLEHIELCLGTPDTRMGSGKGAPEYWVAVVKPGRVMFEIGGVSEEVAREALRLAGHKLPIKTKVIKREACETENGGE